MSQWKSQFDDSEETDNEWKAENLQSPEHRLSLHGVSLVCVFLCSLVGTVFILIKKF